MYETDCAIVGPGRQPCRFIPCFGGGMCLPGPDLFRLARGAQVQLGNSDTIMRRLCTIARGWLDALVR